MNNYRIFDKQLLKEALDLFAPGMSDHITPIKYEAITPDMFMLAFRTSGKDGNEYNFALLEFDYMYSIRHAQKVISKQFAKVIEFLPPVEKQKGRTQLEQKRVRNPEKAVYYLLARTERPKGNGYWASYLQIMPGDNIDEKLADLNDTDKKQVREVVNNILRQNVPTSQKKPDDFIGSWMASTKRSYAPNEELVTNDTNIGINIFKNVSGAWESFYNRVR